MKKIKKSFIFILFLFIYIGNQTFIDANQFAKRVLTKMSNTLKHTRTVSLQTLKNAYQKTKNSDFGQGLVLASGAFGFVLASAKINGKLDQKPTETFNNQREYSAPQKSTIPQILHRSWKDYINNQEKYGETFKENIKMQRYNTQFEQHANRMKFGNLKDYKLEKEDSVPESEEEDFAPERKSYNGLASIIKEQDELKKEVIH
uniref:Uncharacterized protein n=3 Tax=Meloidogyne TaxID=189290 RepID=A0A6V7WBG5_MELEN|nr:unnamed protein product [Meloidogyne enterolobii]